MTWLSKWLIAAGLATSFGPAVHGQNACFTAEKCQVSSAGNVFLYNCDIKDTDLDDLATCLDTAGRSDIKLLALDENSLTTLPSGMFDGMSALESLTFTGNDITTVDEDAFQPVASILGLLSIADNQLTTLPLEIFAGMGVLHTLYLQSNLITTVPLGIFDDLGAVTTLSLGFNAFTTIPSDLLQAMSALQSLTLSSNSITTIEEDAFQSMASILLYLYIDGNQLTTLPSEIFAGMTALRTLSLANNALTTLPAGIFENQASTQLSGSGSATIAGGDIAVTGCCECTDVATCDTGLLCNPGVDGYTCDATQAPVCENSLDCDVAAGEECCASCQICEASADIDVGACGDPHMTGFRGQKFDFTGQDGAWYAVVSDLPYMHLNMRVTSPVPSLPEITYITGISIVTTDNRGRDHTIVISVKNPHSMESSCAAGGPPCLADGALHVVVDGEEVMIYPGEITIAPGVAIGAVNLPGACRSFGFEKYWERKVELLSQASRRLSLMNDMQDMSDWVLADPTATDMVECAEYVAHATAVDGVGLFSHQSEHASFQILTPTATIRLSHGRLHQLPMRDPTDQFDLPDHLTWQMNLAVDQNDMSLDARGILGETLVPTLDEHGAPIMQGMGAIRGAQEDYRVSGPLDIFFAQSQHHE